MGGGQLEPLVLLNEDMYDFVVTMAMRGRGEGWKQQLEINRNNDGTSNTITGVTKDNFVMLPCVLHNERTEYGKAVRKDYESGKLKESRHNMTRLMPKAENTSNTLTSVQKDNLVLDVDRNCDRHVHEPLCFEQRKDGTRKPFVWRNGKRVYQRLRIRNFTPRECFRLMDVDDEDIDKIQATDISKSQQYRLAGNSIVVNNLYHILRKLIIDPNPDMLMEKGTLFEEQLHKEISLP